MELCKSASIKELATALNKAQALMEGAKKDSANPYFKSKYADLESVWAVARQPLAHNGLSVIQLPGKNELGHYLETTLMHCSGEFISGRMFIAPVKEDPQGIGSAITYARRYSLMAALGIAPEDDDGEAAHGRGNRSEPKKEDRPIPGSPQSKSFDNWKAVLWHLPFGMNKATGFEYKGHSLAEILLNDENGLAYWIKTYKVQGKRPEDALLREALDKAGIELAKEEIPKEEDMPQVSTEDLPKINVDENPKEALLKELQILCGKNRVMPDTILGFMKKKKKVDADVKVLADVPIDLIEAVIKNFDFFINLAKKEAK